MKKTNIFVGRDLIGRFACDGKRYSWFGYQKMLAGRMIKNCLTIAALMLIGAWMVTGGILIAKATIEPQTVWGKEIVEVPIIKIAPVMERIKQCESGGKHFDPKTGQVYMLANSNKTVDVGAYMINTIWHKKAKELGYDITTEEGNEAMAYWIYENYGSEPWIYSKHCWNK